MTATLLLPNMPGVANAPSHLIDKLHQKGLDLTGDNLVPNFVQVKSIVTLFARL